MIKLIFKFLGFVLKLFLAVFIAIYFFSIATNISFNDTITHIKTIGSEILNIDISDNIPVNNPDITLLTSTNNHYYYQQLDENGKIIYSAFENNIDNLKKENYIISFGSTFNNLLNQSTGRYLLNKSFQSALDAFFCDHPELFYIDITKILLDIQCFSFGNHKAYTVQISPKDTNYLISTFKAETEVNLAINQLETLKNNIVSEISEYSTYNKIKYVHDMLVNSIKYDSDPNNLNAYDIYGALINKKVVCEGYAKAFKYLLDALDIECILVVGTATNNSNESESHMWNYVKLNDSWYGVDVTWDDPVFEGNPSKNFLQRTFLLKGYYTFAESHHPSGKITDNGMMFTLPLLSKENFR